MSERQSQRKLKRLSLQPGASLLVSKSALASPSSPTPSPSPGSSRSATLGHGSRHASRRMSSISYVSSAGLAPVSPFVRSGWPHSISEASTSAAVRPTQQSPSATSPSTVREDDQESGSSVHSDESTARLTERQTLAEKHSELLSFIAQKESKCLEIRQQLAHQEAELDALKRRWERIVRRSTAASVGSPLESRQIPGVHHQKAAPGEVVTEVVGALRDGVHEFGRYLAGANVTPSTPTGSSNLRVSALHDKSAPSSFRSPASTSRRSQSVSTDSRNSSLSSIMFSPTALSATTAPSSVYSESDDESKDVAKHLEDESATVTPGSLSATSDSNVQTASFSSSPGLTEPELSMDASINGGNLGLRSPSVRSKVDLSKRLSQKEPLSLTSAKSSWMPSAESISRSSKRASTLFSDMSSASSNFLGSLSSALVSPVPNGSNPSSPLTSTPRGSYSRTSSSKSAIKTSKISSLDQRISALLNSDDNSSDGYSREDETVTLSSAQVKADAKPKTSRILLGRSSSLTAKRPKTSVGGDQSFELDDDETWNW